MKNKIYSTLILLFGSCYVFSANPCLDAFVSTMSVPGAEYWNEQNTRRCNIMCLIESELHYQQFLDSALSAMEDCCKDSDEVSY